MVRRRRPALIAAKRGGRVGTPAERKIRPAPWELSSARLLLEPWQWITAPKFFGLERLPRRQPALYVGNHTLIGILDVPLLVLGLQERRGIFLRSLGDRAHFRVPLWRNFLQGFGAVEGSRPNCRALMAAGESILVFPGGAREVFKRKGEAYRLLWGDRSGFARLAIEFGYPIVPFAAVGAEECYDILLDHDDYARLPIWPLIEKWMDRADEAPPVVAGIGPLPRPERFYFRFGRPIPTAAYRGREEDPAVVLEVRERVRRSIERGIRELRRIQAEDPDRHLTDRLRRALLGPGKD